MTSTGTEPQLRPAALGAAAPLNGGERRDSVPAARPRAQPGRPAGREHGTRACYVLGVGPGKGPGCRCGACTAANRESGDRRTRLIAYGRWQPYVDAGPAREHLKTLGAAGVGLKQAAKRAGVSSRTVAKILYGGPDGRPPTRRIRPETEAAILGVHPTLDALADCAVTDATGTRRRIQALVARGWSQARIAARLGMQPGNFGELIYRRPMVTAATARAVAAVYAEWQDQAPPEETHRQKIAASRARRYAADRGWPPPAAWDEIDDPQAGPAGGWQRADQLSGADLAAEARDLGELGLSRREAAQRLGVPARRLGWALRLNQDQGAGDAA